MPKDIKKFFRYASLIIAISFISRAAEHVFIIDWLDKSAWIGAIIMAFIFYLLSE